MDNKAYDEQVSALILELRRGTLILSVLSRLRQPTYGYKLVQELEQYGVPIEGNTLYPLMRRLESQGLLRSEWDTDSNKPRKYYVMTDGGQYVFAKVSQHWKDYINNINALLKEPQPSSAESKISQEENHASK